MSERREASPREGSIEIQYMTEGLHLGDRLQVKEAWKYIAQVIGGLLLIGGVAWGAVRFISAEMVSERLSKTPTPILQKVEMKPTPEDVLGKGSQRWYVWEK